MVRPGRTSTAATGKKRKKVKDDFFEDDEEEAVFMGSDDEGKRAEQSSEDDEDAEANETAEQKRLRLGTLRFQYGYLFLSRAVYKEKCICMLCIFEVFRLECDLSKISRLFFVSLQLKTTWITSSGFKQKKAILTMMKQSQRDFGKTPLTRWAISEEK